MRARGRVQTAVALSAIGVFMFACGLEFHETSELGKRDGARDDVGAVTIGDADIVVDGGVEASPPPAQFCDGHKKALLCEDFENGLTSWSAPVPSELSLVQTADPSDSPNGGGGFALATAAPEPRLKFIWRSITLTKTYSAFSVSTWVRPHISDDDPRANQFAAFAFYDTADVSNPEPSSVGLILSVGMQLYRGNGMVHLSGRWRAGSFFDSDALGQVDVPIDSWAFSRHVVSSDADTFDIQAGTAVASEADLAGQNGIAFDPAKVKRIVAIVGAIGARNDPNDDNFIDQPNGNEWQYQVDDLLIEATP